MMSKLRMLVAVWLVCGMAAGGLVMVAADKPTVEDKPLKIHMISGSKEYGSAESLPAFKEYLEKNYKITCTISMATDGGSSIPDLDKLDGADLLIIFCKRMKLPDAEMEKIKGWFKAGKPAIGIRTSSHAFASWLAMDKEIFGGSYNLHGEGEQVDVKLDAKNKDHPILKGVAAWTLLNKMYRNKSNAEDTIPLLTGTGQTSKDVQPLAWARVYNQAKDARCFYMSLGYVRDFADANFSRMLVNAIYWTTKAETAGRQ